MIVTSHTPVLLWYEIFYICEISCTGDSGPILHGIWVKERWKGLDAFIVFGILVWIPAYVQMNNDASDVHAQWFSHWKIKEDNVTS